MIARIVKWARALLRRVSRTRIESGPAPVWDASCATIVIGATRVPFLSFDILGADPKTKLVRVRAEMALSDYVRHFVERGGLRTIDPIVVHVRHPLVGNKYRALLEDPVVLALSGPSLVGGGGVLTKTIEFGAMAMYEGDQSGRWQFVCGTPLDAKESPEAEAVTAIEVN